MNSEYLQWRYENKHCRSLWNMICSTYFLGISDLFPCDCIPLEVSFHPKVEVLSPMDETFAWKQHKMNPSLPHMISFAVCSRKIVFLLPEIQASLLQLATITEYLTPLLVEDVHILVQQYSQPVPCARAGQRSMTCSSSSSSIKKLAEHQGALYYDRDVMAWWSHDSANNTIQCTFTLPNYGDDQGSAFKFQLFWFDHFDTLKSSKKIQLKQIAENYLLPIRTRDGYIVKLSAIRCTHVPLHDHLPELPIFSFKKKDNHGRPCEVDHVSCIKRV